MRANKHPKDTDARHTYLIYHHRDSMYEDGWMAIQCRLEELESHLVEFSKYNQDEWARTDEYSIYRLEDKTRHILRCNIPTDYLLEAEQGRDLIFEDEQQHELDDAPHHTIMVTVSGYIGEDNDHVYRDDVEYTKLTVETANDSAQYGDKLYK